MIKWMIEWMIINEMNIQMKKGEEKMFRWWNALQNSLLLSIHILYTLSYLWPVPGESEVRGLIWTSWEPRSPASSARAEDREWGGHRGAPRLRPLVRTRPQRPALENHQTGSWSWLLKDDGKLNSFFSSLFTKGCSRPTGQIYFIDRRRDSCHGLPSCHV